MKPTRILEEDLALLDIKQDMIARALSAVPEGPGVWPRRTEAFHRLVSDGRKQALRRWHPDVCSDPQATERSAAINAAADALLTLAIAPPRPVVQFRVYTWGSGSSNTATGTWTTSF
jgi:hypothetical protein